MLNNIFLTNNDEVGSKLRPNPTSFKDIVELWCSISNQWHLKYHEYVKVNWTSNRNPQIYHFFSLIIIDFEVYGCCLLNWQGFRSLIQDPLFPRSTETVWFVKNYLILWTFTRFLCLLLFKLRLLYCFQLILKLLTLHFCLNQLLP